MSNIDGDRACIQNEARIESLEAEIKRLRRALTEIMEADPYDEGNGWALRETARAALHGPAKDEVPLETYLRQRADNGQT